MKVIIGVGVPGSGKSTYLKPLAKNLGLEYINPDEIRQELTGGAANHTKEGLVWKTVHTRLIKALKKKGAIVDATYTKLKDRRQLILLCKKHGAVEVIAYWFRVPLSVCIERNAARERKVPQYVLEDMHSRLDLTPPSLGEGFTTVIELNP